MLRVSHNFPQGRDRVEEPRRNAGAWGSRAGRHRISQIILGRNEWSGIKFGVFGLAKPKLPITEEQRDWIDRSFVRLGGLVGVHRLFEAELMLPTPEHFPDPYDRSEAALQRMIHRIAARMHVNPAEVEVTLFASEDDLTTAWCLSTPAEVREQPACTTTPAPSSEFQSTNFRWKIRWSWLRSSRTN
jgi:hypothetical protein